MLLNIILDKQATTATERVIGQMVDSNRGGNIFYCDRCETSVNKPNKLEPVLAKIEHINSLSKSTWYEVVYFDECWRCYAGSSTFQDGEKVVKWRYCKDCC